MTEYTLTHPLWMWACFGALGSIGAMLFTLTVWQLMKLHSLAKGYQRSATRWNMIGYALLFSAAWFACGIGGTPGNLLSPDSSNHNPAAATGVAVLSMLLSVPGWVSILVGQCTVLRGIQSWDKAA